MHQLSSKPPNLLSDSQLAIIRFSMKMLVHFLIILTLLVFSPYDQVPSLLSVKARKLNPNHGIFTIDLIHHDSLLSPQKRQKRLPFGSILRGHHTSTSSSARFERNVIETDITPRGGGGDYLMKIAIGTPPFEFMAYADTGSNLIWLQCLACQMTQSCAPQESPLFDPTKSSTYQSIPCNSPSCIYPGDCLKNDTNRDGPCIYDISYGDNTTSNGILSTETISFPASSAATLPSAVFGCGNEQQASLLGGAGIIGLGPGPLSLVSQLGPIINYKFSYCLVPPSPGTPSSKLKFGTDLTGLSGVVSTPFAIRSDPPEYYWLTLDGISIGDSNILVGQDIMIDSGTDLTYLETSVYNAVRDALESAIGLSSLLSSVPGPLHLDFCYETPLESLNPPGVVFHFKGADVALNDVNIWWDVGNKTCLTIMPTDSSSMFGNPAQINFAIGYDLQAKQVSFAPANCATF